MSQTKKVNRWALLREPGVQMYLLVSLVSLGMLVFVQLSRKYTLIGQALIPIVVLVGLLGIVVRFRAAPVLLLLLFDLDDVLLILDAVMHRPNLLINFQTEAGLWYSGFQPLQTGNLLLCFAFLAYSAAQFRLQSITYAVFPPDPRQVEDWGPKIADPRRRRQIRHKRSARLVGADEMILLLVGLPVCALLAQLDYFVLRQPAINFLSLPFPLSRLLFVGWVLVVGITVISALLGYWRSAQMTAEQATLFLQDNLWRETRGDQRRLNRWLAWSRLRRKNH